MYFGSNTWKKRWARPSWLTRVPSPSAKVAAGSTRSAALAGGGLLVVGDDQHLGGVERSVNLGRSGAGVQVVFQYHDGIGVAVDHGLQRSVHGLATEHGQAQAVGFRHYQADGAVFVAQLQGLGDVGGGFDQRLGTQRGACDDQWALGRQQGVGNALGQFNGFSVQAFNGRRAGVEGVGHGETEASQVVRRSVHAFLRRCRRAWFQPGLR